MCGLCGMFESGRRWLDAAVTLDPAQVRRERLRRVALVRQVLKPARIAVDDWEGASFILRGPTGKTEIVDNLFDLWRKAEALGHQRLDPLAPRAVIPENAAGDYPGLIEHPRPGAAEGHGSPLSPGSRPGSAGMTNYAPSFLFGARPFVETPPSSVRIPLHVLTGFLGSGKTTLLNRMLRDPAFADSAVLINEVGDIAIDHHLVQRMDASDGLDIVVLKSGCACCTMRGDLVQALRELYARRAEGSLPPFRRVILETTGLADPAPVLFTLASDPALRHKFEVGAIVTTADAVHGGRQALRHPENRKQIAVADVVVVTKTDLASPEAAAALVDTIRRINPAVDIIDGGESCGIASLVAGAPLLSAPRPWTAPALGLGNHPGALPLAHAAEHTPEIDSIAITLRRPVEWSAFAVWLTLLLHTHGDRMLRFKALLQVEGWATPVALDGVHHLVHPPIHLGARTDAPGASHLVFIAEGLPVERIEASLLGFLASSAQPSLRANSEAVHMAHPGG